MSKFFRDLGNAIVLPKQITDFERSYLERMNRITLGFFALHVPVFMAVAYFNDTGPMLALALTLGVMAFPALAYRAWENPRSISVVYGFTSMLMGGLLVHFGQGPVQIEMHFYFFALLAMLALFGNPVVILTAAVTVALHHLILWAVLPSSVFNYDAPIWVVLIHAAFVVLESVATVFIARSFFDNVIGLEKIVQARTAELDERNGAMRLVMDNVDQGFLTVDREGVLAQERSAIVDEWLGAPNDGEKLPTFLGRADGSAAGMLAIGWEQLTAGFLPLDLCLDQLPTTLKLEDKTLAVSYSPIGGEEFSKMLVVLSDVSAQLERERLEADQRESMMIFDRVVSDKAGFLEFFAEAEEILNNLVSKTNAELPVVKRWLHTLKGNCMIFGVQSVANACHEIESRILETGEAPSAAELVPVTARWDRLHKSLAGVLDTSGTARVEIEESQFDELLRAAIDGESHEVIARMIADLRLEPTAARLKRVAAQAERIAARLNKGDISINIDDQMLRLEPGRWATFWSAFVHVVRNAVDHGLESPEERSKIGKRDTGALELRTRVVDREFVIELNDDGRGIDWDAVRLRAEAQGLPSATEADLQEALFADGLSTRGEVSDVSGRGIGMGAVRDACRARGGDVIVRSRAAKGTCFEFRFPAGEMAPAPEAMLSAA